MKHDQHTGGITRRGMLALLAVATATTLISGCGGGDTAPAIAWSADPCGLAPPPAVSAAFAADSVRGVEAPAGECRYRIDDDTLLRIIVLADGDHCEGVQRSLAALGAEVTRPDGTRDGVLVAAPPGDVVVCEADVTYLLSADGRTDQLLSLVASPASQRDD